MSVVRLKGVWFGYERRPVFRGVDFALGESECVGLIGENGTGKTTLLQLVLREREPEQGVVEVEDRATLTYFSQHSAISSERSIEAVMRDQLGEIREINDELERVEAAMADADPETLDRLVHEQAELYERLEHAGGYDAEHRIDVILTKLGFDATDRTKPVDELSSGWRNRAALATILLAEPQVLLLDEPTNYLDTDGVAWLGQWLRSFRGAAIVVSHDRDLLDAVTDRIVEVENYDLQVYDGNYTQYVREKPMRIKSLERQFVHEAELLAYEAEAIADRAQARKDPSKALARRLANVKKQTAPRALDKVVTDVYESLRVPEKLLEADGLAKRFADRTLFEDVTLELRAGERLAVVGPNGSGKSTFLNVLLGEVEPDAGRAAWRGDRPHASYDAILAALPDAESVTKHVNFVGLAYSAPRKRVHRFLAALRFSEADLQKMIGELSGGQRARVALAVALLSGAPVVVLDEPTNHLDIPSIQVMERALVHYPGAVIFVSHDAFFIDKVATRGLRLDGRGGVRLAESSPTMWRDG